MDNCSIVRKVIHRFGCYPQVFGDADHGIGVFCLFTKILLPALVVKGTEVLLDITMLTSDADHSMIEVWKISAGQRGGVDNGVERGV